MTFVPEKNTKTAYILSMILTASGVGFFLFAGASGTPAVYQLIALALCAGGIFILYRYTICSFVYTLDETDLYVTRVTGKKNLTLCSVSYEDITALCKTSEPSKKCDKALSGKFDYTVNLGSKEKSFYLYFPDGKKYIRLTLEGGDELAQAIASRTSYDTEVNI